MYAINVMWGLRCEGKGGNLCTRSSSGFVVLLLAWHSVTHHSIFLDPSSKKRLPPPFPGETVPLLVHAHMCCSPAAQNPHPSLPLFCSSQHKLYSIQMCFDGRRFSWVVLVIFQQLVLVQVLWVRVFNRSCIAFVTAPFLFTMLKKLWRLFKSSFQGHPIWFPPWCTRCLSFTSGICLITAAAVRFFFYTFLILKLVYKKEKKEREKSM